MQTPGSASHRWITVLLLLPLFVLLATGLSLLSRDRRSVEVEARQNADSSARRFLAEFWRAATNLDSAAFLTLTNPWPAGTLFFRINTNGELAWPPPLDRSGQIDLATSLTPAQSNLWSAAERAEFQNRDLPEALAQWEKLLSSASLSNRVAAVARFSHAVLLERSGKTSASAAEFDSLTQAAPEYRLDSGLPIAPLAALKRLKERPELSSLLISNLLAHPTEFTPLLLAQAQQDLADDQFRSAELCWSNQVEARTVFDQFTLLNQTNAVLFLPAADKSSNAWFIFRVSATNFLARSSNNLNQLAISVLQENTGIIPDFLGVELNAAGATLFSNSNANREEPWATAADPTAFRCNIYLKDEKLLYSRQRQRAHLFEALLACSALCAGLGLFFVQRNLRREQRLNEMKSNFVSSVSHELRAPIGSMRLISEALQSGRVLDAEKQREYFNFLVEESRRVSGLIENVLEFSRIEQKRRPFSFEQTDLRDVCTAAAKSVAPLAAERNVRIELQIAEEPLSTSGDPLALQRAVVNLLDNAIKHSPSVVTPQSVPLSPPRGEGQGEGCSLNQKTETLPPRATVTLRATRDTGHLEISVIDHGPGIPTSEHKKIFERFYRLGSELRRETQGVGIGLSIVQHTVEAHGGTVSVESSPGQGATFTLSIPYVQPS